DQQNERTGPERVGHGRNARPVQDEVPVTRRHEVLDLLLALPFREQPMNFAAQIGRDVRLRIGDALVHAERAADLANQTPVALVQPRIVEGGLDVGRTQRGREKYSDHDRDETCHGARTAASCGQPGSEAPHCALINGTKSRRQTSAVSGEMCLKRILPSRPMRKVSGAAVTPQSTATVPSTSDAEATYGLPSVASQPSAAGRSSLRFSP